MRRHPQLAKKLALLYSLRLNPSIKSHADLAEVLGISRQAVGKWARGTETSQGDAIPLAQIENVARIFGISEHWLALEFPEFEAKLYEKLEAESRLDTKKPEKISVSLMPNTPAKIFGRKAELKELDKEWNDRQTNVLQLVAFGGMGKSSLVNAWLSRLDQKGYCGARRVYAWSFYWQAAESEIRSSGDYFIEHALNWFGDEAPGSGSPWEKAERLAKLIRTKRTLLILDGLEPMQYPPGPKHGLIENPAVSLLLKELATENSGLCVVTSRLPVADLTSFEGQRLKTIQLSQLAEKSSIKMLKAMGIHGVHEDYVLAVNEYSGHPLSLSLLGGYLNVVHRGSIGDFRKIRSLLEEQEKGVHARNLMRNYIDWFQDTAECALLFMVGLFDRGVSLTDIETLSREHSNVRGLTAELSKLTRLQYSYAIDRLKQANLLTVKDIDSRLTLDCHPLVRDFLSGFIKSDYPDIWKLGHEAIFEYLRQQSASDPSTMADLEPLFRAVIHGTQAERFESAFELYYGKIKKGQFSIFTNGSHHQDQACLRGFFNNEWEPVCSELCDDGKFYLLSCAATNLIYLGEVSQATLLCFKSIEWFREREKWLDALNIAAPLASMLIMIGEINKVLALIGELEPIVSKSNNLVISAMSKCFKAHALHLTGDDNQAEVLFEEAEQVLNMENPGIPISFPTVSSYYCKFLLETGQAKKSLERSLKTFAWRGKSAWQVAIDTTSLLASDMQILGLAFLALNDRVNARVYLEKQVNLLKDADEWLYLPSGLNARAELHLTCENWESAATDLQEAMEISKRTGARFGEWETALNFARLHTAMGDYSVAENYLEQLSRIPNMNSYLFRNGEIERIRGKIRHARRSNTKALESTAKSSGEDKKTSREQSDTAEDEHGETGTV